MSVIQQMMSAHRLVGGIVYDAVMLGDFSLLSQFDVQHCAPYFPVPERIVAYHYVRRGVLTCVLPGSEPVTAPAGTMVLFPRNDAHVICSAADVPPTPFEQIVSEGAPSGAYRLRTGSEGPECALYCGWMGVEDSDSALLAALPAMLMATPGDGAGSAFLASSLRYAAEDLYSRPELVARLSQMFFEEAVRRYIETLSPDEERSLAALRDPAIGRALAVLQSEGAEPVTLETVAQEAGLSRTVLTERFVAVFGESPMRYRARWRMRRAADLLRDNRASIADVAYSTGFSSEAAFTRAFKREHGLPPAAWRHAHCD